MAPRLLPLAALWLGLLLGGAAAGTPVGAGVDRSLMDPQVRPQDDLFRAANGRWLRDTPIPADRADHGVSREMSDRVDQRLRTIVDERVAQPPPAGSDEAKLAAYYRSFLDEAAIDRAGDAPLEGGLAQVDAVRSRRDLAVLFGRWQGMVPVPLEITIAPDAKEPGIYRVQVGQSGLGLPDRDHYLKHGSGFARVRAAYRAHLQTLLRLAGDKEAAAHAATVLRLETRLAKAQWPAEHSRDPLRTYNPTPLPALSRRAPGLDWPALLDAAALPGAARATIAQPSYAKALAAAVRSVPLADWRLYLRVRWLQANAMVLPQAFRDAAFAFEGKALNGQQQPLPRWQQAIAALDGAMGEAVGRLYVQRFFPPENKARVQVLVDHLMRAYAESIDSLRWMSPATKQRSRTKLAKYVAKIGYPDSWRDYAALEVRHGDPVGNLARAGRFEHERRARREGQPVDRGEWEMTPQTVNAYYNASANEIVFPAAVLEPPYFDLGADDAVNYGAIGATIGHEISHGFDDEGSRYDGDGKLADWWAKADRKAFDTLGARLAAQFSTYQPITGQRINGRLTLGENMADLAGLEIALKAYHLSLGGRSAPVIDGLNGDQRFFIAYAQSWREAQRAERTLAQLASDPHAPPEYRTNGAVVNIDAFHQAFGTRPGDRLYKPGARRIRIW